LNCRVGGLVWYEKDSPSNPGDGDTKTKALSFVFFEANPPFISLSISLSCLNKTLLLLLL